MISGFDQYATGYQKSVQNALDLLRMKTDFFLHIKIDHLLDTSRRLIGRPDMLNMLDVGCGPGLTDAILVENCRQLSGVDTSADMVKMAKRNAPEVQYRVCEDDRLPYADAVFDIAFAICVLHHITVTKQKAFLQEMRRVVRTGGCVAIYEHNPWNPFTRLIVDRCEFDHGVVLARRRDVCSLMVKAGMKVVTAPYLFFFPWHGILFRRLERLFTSLPIGAQYAVWGRV